MGCGRPVRAQFDVRHERHVSGPAPSRKRSGKSGKNKQPQRQLRAPDAFWRMVEAALRHNRGSPNDCAYSGWSDWARHHLAIAVADELELDPLEVLRSLDSG